MAGVRSCGGFVDPLLAAVPTGRSRCGSPPRWAGPFVLLGPVVAGSDRRDRPGDLRGRSRCRSRSATGWRSVCVIGAVLIYGRATLGFGIPCEFWPVVRRDLHVPLPDLPVRPAHRQGPAQPAGLPAPTSSFCRTTTSCCSRSSTSRRIARPTSSATSTTSRSRASAGSPAARPALLYRLIYHWKGRRTRPSEVTTFAALAVDDGADLPAVPAGVRPVPHHRRLPAPVRLRPAGDPSPVPAGAQPHRLLAAHQHLLEGLHGEDGVLPGVLPPAASGRDARAGRGHGWRCSW